MFKIFVCRYLLNISQFHVYKIKQIFGICTARFAPCSSVQTAL